MGWITGICTLLVLYVNILHAQKDPQIVAVEGLINRWVPSYAGVFQLELIISGSDIFELQTNGSFVVIRGNTGVALSYGLNYYLKYFCFCQISWAGDQLTLPDLPPVIPSPISMPIVALRYYFNVCTFGYSTVWWNYTRWEREIDWMALNGINFPLAFTGQEAVWRVVYLKLGLTDSDLLEYFTGPAFLPWNRMGNVNAWGGGLTSNWLKQRTQLQIQILGQMRSFGMTPILPAFAGHVPPALATQYPNANIIQLGGWNTFNGTYFLAPTDPLFSQISSLFIKTQTSMYGTDHYYNADLFNELEPPTSNVSYLTSVSKAAFSAMQAGDSDAIWVMQGWFLVNGASFWQPPQAEAFLNAIPQGNLIMLDLWAELNPVWNKTQKFYGHSFIWCMLHNFGGRTGLYGAIQNVASYPFIASSQAPNLMGFGLTPEAIETNVIMYDLMMEMPWRTLQPNAQILLPQIGDWVLDFTHRRYGQIEASAVEGWLLLQKSVYSCAPTYYEGPPRSFIALRPDTSYSLSVELCYDPQDVIDALVCLVNSSTVAPAIAQQETFQHDIASVARQVMSNAFLVFFSNMMDAYSNKNAVQFSYWSNLLLGTIIDLDVIVSTQEMWLVGKWISDAMSWGTNEVEITQYNFNARNQLTLWGPADSGLHDYAYKLWGGLVRDFYYPRWDLFVTQLAESLQDGTTFDYPGYVNLVSQIEYAWCLANNTYTTTPTGDAVSLAAWVLNKYAPLVSAGMRTMAA